MLTRRNARPLSSEPHEVRARWEELQRAAPELAQGIELHRAVQRLQREADLRPRPPPFTAGSARDRLAAGVPLLSGTGLFFDVDAALTLFARLARAAVRGDAKREAAAILAASERGALDLCRAMEATCALDEAAAGLLLQLMGEQAGLAMALLRFALAPAFQAAAEAYEPFMDGSPWDWAVCPICGAVPLLGELRGGESRRVLRCGRCGAAWGFQRLRCVFCDTSDHGQLTALHLEGEGDFLRIDACDSCDGYIKTLARLDPIPYELLPAEDLATAHLDLLALERGYRRP